jgi:hypothetical protein
MNEPLPYRGECFVYPFELEDSDNFDGVLADFRATYPRLAHNGLQVAVFGLDSDYDEVDDDAESGDGDGSHHYLVEARLADTSKYADALREYAPEIAKCTLESETMITLVLRPDDRGLPALLGGELNPAWHAVRVYLQNGQLVQLYVEFADIDCHEVSSDRLTRPDTILANVAEAFRRFMEPWGSLVFTPRGAWNMLGVADDWIHVRDDMTARSDFPSRVKRQWRQMAGPMSQFEEQLEAVQIDIQTTRLLSTVNDRCLTWDLERDAWKQGWMHKAEHRAPFTQAQICEFCIGTHGAGLSSYVILWIINWLPHKQLIDDVRKLRWAEAVLTSIRRVLDRRPMRRSERIKAKVK